MTKTPQGAAASGLPSYNPDDAVVDLTNLAHLIEAITDIVHEIPRPADNPDIVNDLNRISAFGFIGVEMLKRIADKLANMPEEVRS